MKPAQPAWIVSDVHLFFGGEDYLNQFLRFLDEARANARTLFIAGDLFEFWIGDRQGNFAFYRPLFDKLRELVDAGLKVYAIHGNRDFLMGSAFERAGVELLPEEIELEGGEHRIHLSHGDQFCIHDISYQRARVVMRSAPVRLVAKCLPAFVGVALAKLYRGISERKKAGKKMLTGNRYHTIEDGVVAEFEKGRCDVVVCGHIHFLQDAKVDVAGRPCRVITTGAWEEDGPNWVVFESDKLHLNSSATLA